MGGALGAVMRVGEQVGKAHAQMLALAPGIEPTTLPLDPTAGYVLSRIDGRTNWETLRQIGALRPQEIDVLVEKWLKEGVLVASAATSLATVRAAKPSAAEKQTGAQASSAASAASTAAKSAAPVAPARNRRPATELPEIDSALELDIELQREILEFAAGLGRLYHEILGVSYDADARTIKKAYFGLSKKLHPDRYFRRNTGAFGPLIESCFKRLLEAYELLSDPTTRKQVQGSETAAPRVPIDASVAASARSRGLDARRRLRERVSSMAGHARARDEQRRKAKSFYESGMSAFSASKWLEAAGAVRLAIAFDPDNSAYRESFPDIQRKAHDERAKHLVKQAEGALELRDYQLALDHFEEALHYRPADGELAYRSAKLSMQVSGDLKRAKEFAAQAVEVAPDKCEYRKMLAGVYAAAGLRANAKREYEAALRIDANDKEAKSALRSLS